MCPVNQPGFAVFTNSIYIRRYKKSFELYNIISRFSYFADEELFEIGIVIPVDVISITTKRSEKPVKKRHAGIDIIKPVFYLAQELIFFLFFVQMFLCVERH